ncbi:MAG: hypothetical protein ACI9KE_002009 [Polyangiales bacterium]|jgi:hypothetical protein
MAEEEERSKSERLVLWRSKEPMAKSAVEDVVSALSAHVVGDGELDAWTERTFGCVLVDGSAPEVSFGPAIAMTLPFPAAPTPPSEDGGNWATFGEALPAAPLALQTKQPVHRGFDLAFTFSKELAQHERAGLSDLFSLFEAAYTSDDEDIAVVEETVELQSASLRVSAALVDDASLRAHAYWLVEVVDRFWPLARADFRGGSGKQRGLRPSWLGPVVTMAAALVFARFASGPDAARSSMLALLFLPLVFTFLSRNYVSKATWIAAIFNAAGVGLMAALVEDPGLLWPIPESPSAEFLAEIQGHLVTSVYIARSLCLVWVLPYLRSGRTR